MGLFSTVNNNVYIYMDRKTGHSKHGHRPPDNDENWAAVFEVLLGVGIAHYADPYMSGVRVMLAHAIEAFNVLPAHASTASEIVCFTVICAAPAILRRLLRKFLK